ncbi:hypothetical protein FRC01_003974, partial [Tulasnella sp. 417]
SSSPVTVITPNCGDKAFPSTSSSSSTTPTSFGYTKAATASSKPQPYTLASTLNYHQRASNQQLHRNKETYAQTVGFKSAQACGKKHNRKRNTPKFEGDIPDASGRFWVCSCRNSDLFVHNLPSPDFSESWLNPPANSKTPLGPRIVLSPDYDPRFPQTLAKSSRPRRFVAKPVVKEPPVYDATLCFRQAQDDAEFLRLVELSNQAYDRAENPRILHPSGISAVRRHLLFGNPSRASPRRALKRAVRTRTSSSAKNLITS